MKKDMAVFIPDGMNCVVISFGYPDELARSAHYRRPLSYLPRIAKWVQAMWDNGYQLRPFHSHSFGIVIEKAE